MEQFHTTQNGKKYIFLVEPDEYGMKVHSVVFGNVLHLFPLDMETSKRDDPFDGKSYRDAIKKAKAKHGVGSVSKHPRLLARIKKVGTNVEISAMNVTHGIMDRTFSDGSSNLMAILAT